MYKNVVFDLGNVLIRWDPRNLYRKIFHDESKMNHFLGNICTLEWNEKQDAGRPWAEGVAELTAKHPEWQNEIRAYDERWVEMLGAPLEGTVEILEKLKAEKKVKLYALSNWSVEKFAVSEGRFPFLKLFDGMVISGRVGLQKPDPRIYHHLCNEFGVKPQESVFIDDMPRNLKPAQELGFRCVHFTTGENLLDELTSLRILG